MKLISNRKLYRLGVIVAFLMTGFLVYLMYNDVSYTEINDVPVRERAIGYSDMIYAREELANQVFPVDDVPLTSKNSLFKSALTRENRFNFVLTEDNSRKVRPFEMAGHFKSGEYETSTKSIDSTPTAHLQINDAFLFQHSSQKKSTTPIFSLKTDFDKNMDRLSSSRRVKNISMINVRSKVNGDVKSSISSIHEQPSENGKKFFVYLCTSGTWCGGWGDRQRGIVSAYHFAKLIGREFRIVMDTPCNLTQFYRPFRHDWILRPGEIPPTARTIVLNIISKPHFKDRLKEGDFNQLYPHDAIFIKINQDLVKIVEFNPVYSKRIKRDRNLLSKKSRMRSAWRELMQPTEYIQSHLEHLVGPERLILAGLLSKPLKDNVRDITESKHSVELKDLRLQSSNSLQAQRPHDFSSEPTISSPKPLICAHIRMGKNPSNPMDEIFDSFKPGDIPKLLNFLQSKDTKNNSEFFLATDFEDIRGSFLQFFGNRLLQHGGRIIHIDRQRVAAEACHGFGIALLDQLVLSICDILVISRSGFSMHASYVSNSSQPVYIMEDGIIKTFV